MTLGLLLGLLGSTPLIDGYVSGCATPVVGFAVPVGPVAAAAGQVSVVDGRLEVEHCFFENAEVRTVRSVIDGLTAIEVKTGELVSRGQRLGHGVKARTVIDGVSAAHFVRGRERLMVPSLEQVLVVVDVEGHRAVRFSALQKRDRKSTRLNSSHPVSSRLPSSG